MFHGDFSCMPPSAIRCSGTYWRRISACRRAIQRFHRRVSAKRWTDMAPKWESLGYTAGLELRAAHGRNTARFTMSRSWKTNVVVRGLHNTFVGDVMKLAAGVCRPAKAMQ
jgi:hypothetical protein